MPTACAACHRRVGAHLPTSLTRPNSQTAAQPRSARSRRRSGATPVPRCGSPRTRNSTRVSASASCADHEAAARGELAQWQATPEGALALVILLDQFPRNAFRGTPRMYDTDAMARKVANTAFAAGYDQKLPRELQKFFVLPFAHSEDLADQERSVALARRIGPDDLAHAEHHRDIVRRFGRFPHRNAILGRKSTPEEKQYLDNGGYTG